MGNRIVETGAGNRTVEEMCLGAVGLLTEAANQAADLRESSRLSGATLSGNALNEAMLLFWHSQAMAELSALLFWLERNDYARSLMMKQALGSYGHISMAMMKLIDLVGLVLDYADQLGLNLSAPDDMDYGIEQAFA